MMEWLSDVIPNIMDKLPSLQISFIETLYMLAIAGSLSVLIGLIFGVILTVTKKDHILQNIVLYTILDKILNLFRSIPFIILVSLLIYVSQAIVGTFIGPKGALVPLVFATVPFYARQIESVLAEVSDGLIEASLAMGITPIQIIIRVYLKESIPGIIRSTMTTFISLIGLIAMVGVVAGGGLGDFAIRYGFQRSQVDVIYVVVIIILCLVTIIQWIGNYFIKKYTH